VLCRETLELSLELAAPIRHILLSYIAFHRFQFGANRGYGIASCPKGFTAKIPRFAFELSGYRNGTFAFEEPNDEAIEYFGGISMHICT
jgi:hypothetical protein